VRIRIQFQIQGFDGQNWNKFTAGNLFVFFEEKKLQFAYPKLQEKPSTLKREHSALQNMKILDFFLFLWVFFAILDPDPGPASQINVEPCGSGS
jgi:hypothetical protein